MAVKKRAASGKPKRSPASTVEHGLRINVPGAGQPFALTTTETDLQKAAMRWTYTVRNRRRWADGGRARKQQGEESRAILDSLGIGAAALDAISAAGVAEVDIPYLAEDQGWEQRIFPWEYMIAAATRDARGDRELTVVRRLRVPAPATRRLPAPLLHVETAPGSIRDEFVFTSERQLVKSAFGLAPSDYELITDPSASELKAAIERIAPGVVHLSGVDSHEGAELLDGEEPPDLPDGLMLRGTTWPYEALPASGVASAVTAAHSKPLLVSCNVANSAARIAALCVAEGAESAIGFQDTFDDGLAELFYSTFYRAWRLSEWNTAEAFRYAWTLVHGQGRSLRGTGVVLWSCRSILDPPVAAVGQPQQQAGLRSVVQIGSLLQEDVKKSQVRLTEESARDLLDIEIVPVPALNYSILHNNGPLFTRFRILKKNGLVSRVDDLFVSVELHVGTDSFPYRLQLSLEEWESTRDLLDDVRVSLASTLNRGVRESMHTSLFVEVRWRETTLYRKTHRVTLLPVDEWRDDADNRKWLPSFVLPRDPVVPATIEAAQRYLMALRDDATAGFDGYQCVDNPGGDPSEACEGVDMQVRAIWSALLYETPLAYINPPPTFTDASQRLRSPSEVINGRRGTCIDLALLFASCLEYIEIYPAIILLRSHAFPAYWRDDSYHDDFREARGIGPLPVATGSSIGTVAPTQRYSWYLERTHYREILNAIHAGRLIPIETVALTERGAFADAIDEGLRNLSGQSEFDSMVDITLARTDARTPVTPLPLRRVES